LRRGLEDKYDCEITTCICLAKGKISIFTFAIAFVGESKSWFVVENFLNLVRFNTMLNSYFSITKSNQMISSIRTRLTYLKTVVP
jgi:hypothetical protein